MKFNIFISAAAVVLLSANLAWAQDSKIEASKSENVVQKITGQEKKTRKKKVEMCAECGKPESECECHGHEKKDHKEEAKKSAEGK